MFSQPWIKESFLTIMDFLNNMLVNKIKNKKKYDNPTVVSLFTCGMGMDKGFEKAGFQTIFANDITKFACKTIRTIKKKEIKDGTLYLDERSIFLCKVKQ